MADKKKKLPLWAKILLGMLLGIVWGLIAVKTGLEQFTSDWVKPWGTIFIKLLKLLAVPLIFVSLVKGITSITDMTKLSRIGLKTLGLYLLSTVITITAGLLLVNTVKPGNSFSEEKRGNSRQNIRNLSEKRKMWLSQFRKDHPLPFLKIWYPIISLKQQAITQRCCRLYSSHCFFQ